jgi:hypothetical protein
MPKYRANIGIDVSKLYAYEIMVDAKDTQEALSKITDVAYKVTSLDVSAYGTVRDITVTPFLDELTDIIEEVEG